jgi:hypothetical protein
MNCTICDKPVILSPSAKERAKKYGDHPASYYTKLFPTHTECAIKKRNDETSELMRSKHDPAH